MQMSDNLPAKLLNRLQAVINTAARLVRHAMKADHITQCVERSTLAMSPGMVCVLAFKCQHSLAPRYLSDQLQQVARM